MTTAMTTIEKCREFYNNDVAPMIHEQFPEYEGRIAAGLAGEGSECWGYDDVYSQDHDFAVSICLWLTDEDHAKIGGELDEAYRALIRGRTDGTRLEYRRGPQKISDFYTNQLGFGFDTVTPALTDGQWFYAEDWRLAAAVNGKVFRDDLGQFTRVRDLLEGYYPERIFRMKLANALHGYAGTIQANYPRCMARGDHVAAFACVSKGMEEAMRIAFLLCRKYMPYYKWSYRALRDLASQTSRTDSEELSKLADILAELAVTETQAAAWESYMYDARRVNMDDKIVRLSEEAADILAGLLYRQGLTDSKLTFLEAHCAAVARGAGR